MGIDLLDIAFRVEEKLGISLNPYDWDDHFQKHRPYDITVGELVEVVLRSGRCGKCRYDLRGHGGHGTAGVCPECGSRFGPLDETMAFEAVRSAVVAALRVKPDQVKPDALLIRDLGMS